MKTCLPLNVHEAVSNKLYIAHDFQRLDTNMCSTMGL